MSGPRKLIFIAGAYRSGSTLLERLLAGATGVSGIGEAMYAFTDALEPGRRCGCGEPIRACGFWQDAFAQAFGGFAEVPGSSLAPVADWLHGSGGRGNRLRQVATWRKLRRDGHVAAYVSALGRLYAALGADVVVDSSKEPAQLLLLRELADVELYVVHLVRDSRAVAFSWQRTRARRDVVGRDVFFPRLGSFRSAVSWTLANVGTEWLLPDRARAMRVRYEDLVRDPSAEVARILHFAQVSVPERFAWKDGLLPSTHGIAGNPMRFERTGVRAEDDEWRTALPPRRRALVTLMTYPLLRRYGYR